MNGTTIAEPLTRAEFFSYWLARTEHDMELRAFPSKTRIFSRNITELEDFTQQHMQENLFFGVNSRQGGGKKEHVTEVIALYADLDFKDYAGGEGEALEVIEQFEFEPSIVINSGNGLHAYWFLKEAEEPTPEVEAILRGIAIKLHSDVAVCELARIMRLPGTFNYKNANNIKPVTVVKYTGNEFLLSDFEYYANMTRQEGTGDAGKAQGRITSEKANHSCDFLRHCYRNPELSEPEWFSMITNIVAIGGASLCHEYSHGYPQYSKRETDEKILHATEHTPHTCQYITETHKYGCKKTGCTGKSPAATVKMSLKSNELHTPEALKGTVKAEIDKVVADTDSEKILETLKQIASLDTETEKAQLVNLLSKRTAIPKRVLLADMKALRSDTWKRRIEENLVVVHPAYESNGTFLSLGFKETIVVDGNPTDRNLYIISNNGEITVTQERIFRMKEYNFIFNDRERVLLSLSDRWNKKLLQEFSSNPVSPGGLYNEIKDIIRSYIEFQDEALYGLTASWVIATYFHRLFHSFPFLSFHGKKQCGKSRILDLFERLCFNAFKTKGISIPSLADSVDGTRCTVLIDQAEILSQKQYMELLGILADSYTSGGGRRRIVSITNKARRIIEFQTYAPKAFASIKDIDVDLKDRTIEIIMIRAEHEYPYPDAFLPIWGELRDKLYRLLLTKWQEAKRIYETAGQDMAQRVRELWRPLDTILVLEQVPQTEIQAIKAIFLESMQETQTGLSENEEALIQALHDLLGMFDEGVFTTSEIVEKMGTPDTKEFSKKQQARWVGKTINRLQLYSKKLGKKDNRFHQYLFQGDKIRNISQRYEVNGLMAITRNSKDVEKAIEKTAMAGNGLNESKSQQSAIKSHYEKLNGSLETVDNSQYSQQANGAIEYIENENTCNDDFFIPEIDEPDSRAWEV